MSWRRRKFFNLIIADPPYFSGPEKRLFYGNKIAKNGVKRKVYDAMDTWKLPDANWFELAKQATDHLIIWGANYFDFIGPVHKTPRKHELEKWINEHPRGWIVWDKMNASSTFNDFELAWTNIDMPTIVYQFMWNGMCQGKSAFEGHIMQGNKKLNQKRIHPTEKPIELYKWLFHKFAKPGYRIYDTHEGSGPGRIAAYHMGLDYWGTEKNTNYHQKQDLRFKLIKSQQKISWV